MFFSVHVCARITAEPRLANRSPQPILAANRQLSVAYLIFHAWLCNAFLDREINQPATAHLMAIGAAVENSPKTVL